AAGMTSLTQRVKDLNELAENAAIYLTDGSREPDPKAARLLTPEARSLLAALARALPEVEDWTEERLEAAVRDFATAEGVKLGDIAQPLRAALTGRVASPGIFEVLAILGRDET